MNEKCVCLCIYSIVSREYNLILYHSIEQKGILSTHYSILPSHFTLELQESIYLKLHKCRAILRNGKEIFRRSKLSYSQILKGDKLWSNRGMSAQQAFGRLWFLKINRRKTILIPWWMPGVGGKWSNCNKIIWDTTKRIVYLRVQAHSLPLCYSSCTTHPSPPRQSIGLVLEKSGVGRRPQLKSRNTSIYG